MEKSSLKTSLLGIIGTILILLVGTLVLKIDTIIILMVSIIYIGLVSTLKNWKINDVLDGMREGCNQGFIGLLFFLLIGAVIGTWIQSGTVPALVYYGLDLLNPKYFLVTSFLVCCIVSTILGTSWGTVGTIGVAIMGMAVSSKLSIPLGIIAGTIVSGAWFGDKMSPISDTNVLIATTSKVDIYKHIKVMMYSTLPSFLITLVILIFINRHYTSNITMDYTQISIIKDTLEQEFNLGITTFIPVIALVILCVLKVEGVTSLILATAIAVICSVFIQGDSLIVSLESIMNGFSIETGVAEVDVLLNRGGINSMMPTFLLGFMALCLGGVIQKTGFVDDIIKRISSRLKSVFSVVLTTMITCVLGNAVFADTYLTIVLNSNMYRKLYDERQLDLSMLSRTIAEAATMSTPLIPWTAASAFIVGALGVPTTQYAAFAILNLVNPIVSLILTFFKILVVKKEKQKEEQEVIV